MQVLDFSLQSILSNHFYFIIHLHCFINYFIFAYQLCYLQFSRTNFYIFHKYSRLSSNHTNFLIFIFLLTNFLTKIFSLISLRIIYFLYFNTYPIFILCLVFLQNLLYTSSCINLYLHIRPYSSLFKLLTHIKYRPFP